jgi:hypothetical protein
LPLGGGRASQQSVRIASASRERNADKMKFTESEVVTVFSRFFPVSLNYGSSSIVTIRPPASSVT